MRLATGGQVRGGGHGPSRSRLPHRALEARGPAVALTGPAVTTTATAPVVPVRDNGVARHRTSPVPASATAIGVHDAPATGLPRRPGSLRPVPTAPGIRAGEPVHEGRVPRVRG